MLDVRWTSVSHELKRSVKSNIADCEYPLDCGVIPSGTALENLADTYVIFITENDVLGKNKPLYHIERYIKESEEYFYDGSHILYINAS